MLSDEERKAVEWFQEDLAEEKENCGKYNDYKKQVVKRNEKILNLIKKQSKEIEELKENMRKRVTYCNELEKDLFENCSNYVVSKDKIKAFIKEELPDDEICSCCKIIDVNGVDLKKKLQSLLEEEEYQ